jgi:hypothetical protein
MWLIDLFAVAPESDDAFLTDWESERGGCAVLYRALRVDVGFRFVSVARVDDRASASGRYAAVHEEGAPDGAEGVTLVNPVEVPEGEDERFVAGWERARAALADQRGYLGTRLHRSTDGSHFRFVRPRALVEPADVRPRDAAPRVPRGRRCVAVCRASGALQRRPRLMLAAARTTRDNAAVRLHRAPAAPATPAYEPELGRVLRVAHLAALTARLKRRADGV